MPTNSGFQGNVVYPDPAFTSATAYHTFSFNTPAFATVNGFNGITEASTSSTLSNSAHINYIPAPEVVKDPLLSVQLRSPLKYLKRTLHMGLQFYSHGIMHIDRFSDANWSSDRDDRRSRVGYYVYFSLNLISWYSKKQAVVSMSSTESEHRAYGSF